MRSDCKNRNAEIVFFKAYGYEDVYKRQYKGFVMQHKFPFVSLQIQMTGNDLDVNVHPRKLEDVYKRQVQDNDIIEELKGIDIGNLTPMEALNTLYNLQNKIKNRW